MMNAKIRASKKGQYLRLLLLNEKGLFRGRYVIFTDIIQYLLLSNDIKNQPACKNIQYKGY